MLDDTVRLKLLPVCECGYVFNNGIICNKYDCTDERIVRSFYHSFEPHICPNCGREIERVLIDKDIINFVKQVF